MSHQLIDPGAVDPKLEDLVNQYLEGSLSTGTKADLESLLENQEEAQDYFIERVRFHAELVESQQPLRIELTQKRQVVFEYAAGIPKVTTREAQSTRIGNPRTQKFVHLVPDNTLLKRGMWTLVLLAVVAVGLAIWFYVKAQQAQVVVAPPPLPVLALRNASFEDTSLEGDEDGFNYSILDWQDHFLVQSAGICKVEAYHPDFKAVEGENAAVLKGWSFLTQRLKYSDGKPFKAKKGMLLRLSGRILVMTEHQEARVRGAIRVVKGVHPEMLQYEASQNFIMASSREWAPFTMDFKFSEDSLVKSPRYMELELENKVGDEMDLDGEALTLSIDNKSRATILLDQLSLKLVEGDVVEKKENP